MARKDAAPTRVLQPTCVNCPAVVRPGTTSRRTSDGPKGAPRLPERSASDAPDNASIHLIAGQVRAVDVTSEIVVEMLGAPKPDPDFAGRLRRPGTVLGLHGARWPRRVVRPSEPPARQRGADLTGLQDESMQESARTAMSWLPANAGAVRSRPVLPAGHRRASSRAGGELGAARRSLGGGRHGGRPGNGVDRPAVCGDLAMTGEITWPAELAAQVGRELFRVGGGRQRVDGLARRGCPGLVGTGPGAAGGRGRRWTCG